jgi:hypothetical protein
MSTIRDSLRAGSIAAALLILPSLGAPLAAQVAAADVPKVTFGSFIDAYYAYDTGRPLIFDRGYTTQAVRANEFNINLAHIEANIAGERIHGRLALQAGTSVHANYAGEPAIGAYGGPSLARHLQEAYLGYKVSERLWIDAGIFFSNMGDESWISSDNITYTRSLVADYSPYYSSGVRAVFQATPKLAARLDVMNGWQNISETNTDKAVGTRLDYTLRDGIVLTHYLYAGTETGGRLRTFTGVAALAQLTPKMKLEVQVDVGQQGQADGSGTDSWNGGVLAARWALSEHVSFVSRGEWYRDPAQVIIATGGPDPFRATGGSLGLDVTPGNGFMWRTEVRALSADAELFADRDAAGGASKTNLVLVSAFTLRM